MEVVYARCAGLDVHKKSIAACVRIPGGQAGRRAAEVRTFRTTLAGLAELTAWLATHAVTHVAMESTGIYWRPVYAVLEGVVEVVLVTVALAISVITTIPPNVAVVTVVPASLSVPIVVSIVVVVVDEPRQKPAKATARLGPPVGPAVAFEDIEEFVEHQGNLPQLGAGQQKDPGRIRTDVTRVWPARG